jgi:hypothetical protein
MNTEERISGLEKRCRLLTRVVYGLIAAAGVAVFCGALGVEIFEKVQTEELEIVDANGTVRMRLGKADEGYGIVIYDATGRFRATLTDAPRGAGIQLINDGGAVKIFSYQDAVGISLSDAQGRPRAVTMVSKDGPKVQLMDETGKPLGGKN